MNKKRIPSAMFQKVNTLLFTNEIADEIILSANVNKF